MGAYLEKLRFNSRLDNSREHVVRGERTRSTKSVSSKLLAAGKDGSPCMVYHGLSLLEE